MKIPYHATALIFATSALAEPELTVYAPDYFASEWGPGPAIEAAFEETCACDLVFRTGDVLSMLLLEGARTQADVVIGLNTDVSRRARETGLFAPHGQPLDGLTLPIDWTDTEFLPFSWGYTAFVYDEARITNPPKNFADLLAMPDDTRIVIQDPRSSFSGLALVLWIEAVFGEDATKAWTRLDPKILTVTKDWAEAYGLFTRGEADMVLSYTTSPAYHIMVEQDHTKHAAIFDEGHYFMAEVAGRIRDSAEPELAAAFMEFILTQPFQSLIPTKNFGYPTQMETKDWPQVFRELPSPDKAHFFSEDEAHTLRRDAIERWRAALSG